MKIKNINNPTSAKWSKFGMALVSVSATIAGYGLTQNVQIVGFIGLGCAVVGTFIVNMLD